MDCPRCGHDSIQSVASCAACALSLESVSQTLGSNLVSLESLTDAAHCLRVREKELLRHELDGFQQAFPQVFLAVYLGVLPNAPSASEIAFWLLNHAAFQPSDPTRLNERAALLLIDPVARTAGLTVGYGLEPYLPHKSLLGILRHIRTPLWHGEYAGAIELGIALIGKALRSAGKRVPKQVEVPAPGADADFFQASGLQSLRDSAQPPSARPEPSEKLQRPDDPLL
jgi:hypothetical protein